MTLSDYTFQLNSGVVLNDDSLGLPYVDIDRVIGLDSAPYRETIRDHEGADGGYIDAEFERGREVILEGTAFCDLSNVEPYMDSLKSNFAPVTSPIPFVYKSTGVGERLLYVKPRGVRYDWDTLRRIGMTRIQFLMYAEDPRAYDNSLLGVTIPFGGPATTGFGFNLGFNIDFGATVPPSTGTVTNSGNRPMPAIMTIEGPVLNPRIINITDSKTLNFEIDLGASDTLVIDLANRTVTLNGVQNRRDSMKQADWFLFNVGTTSLSFGGGSGSGDLTINFRYPWR